MDEQRRPVIVAYDGSPTAEAALRAAVPLFPERSMLVATVWEPGLALAIPVAQDPTGLIHADPAPEEAARIDRLERDHAAAVAEAGADLARTLGAAAATVVVRDRLDVAETLAGLAEEHDAAAVVIGSRGLGTAMSRLFGSTSRRLLRDTRRPVLVVRAGTVGGGSSGPTRG